MPLFRVLCAVAALAFLARLPKKRQREASIVEAVERTIVLPEPVPYCIQRSIAGFWEATRG